jgi:hypothetical protein
VHDWSFDLHMLLGNTRFPRLRALTLSIHACPEPTNARAFAALLERTPTLHHVAWRYLEPNPLTPGTLPALRSLCADVPDSPGTAGRALLPGAALVALGPICVVASSCTLDVMAQMRGEALRVLDVARFESIPLLVRVVRLFPCLRWLRVPAVDYWHEHASVTPAPVHRAEWFEVIVSIPMLEVFRGVSLFLDPERVSIEENDERARHVLNTCPRMRQVEHWDLDPGHVIVLGREGGRVVWRVERVDDVDSSLTHIFPRAMQEYDAYDTTDDVQ